MANQIKLYRIVLNILFFIFYVLLVSIAFSFLFPTIMVLLWKEVLSPFDPLFDSIQIAITIIVLIFSFIFRKYFYLPIYVAKNEIIIEKKEKNNIETKKEDFIEKPDFKEINNEEEIELDIKIGKEIR